MNKFVKEQTWIHHPLKFTINGWYKPWYQPWKYMVGLLFYYNITGKRLQFANWKITIFQFGKSTISMGHVQ